MSKKVLGLTDMRTCIRTAGLVLFAVVAVASRASAKGPDIFPKAQVRPGLKGYAMTTFRGAVPERFEVEIIGIRKNGLPKQDMFVFKSEDPKVVLYGVTAGMSGSPIYIDGRIACAISYSYIWNKVTIGECTPVEYMITDSKRKLRGPDGAAVARKDEWEEKKTASAWLLKQPAQAAPRSDTGLAPVGIPLSAAGLTPRAFDAARQLFAPFQMEPIEGAGGGGRPDEGPSRYEAGGNISVLMSTGDVSMSGLCTVTLVDENKVLACGHPMFGLGEIYAPAANADVHTLIPRLNNSFKLSSPTRQMGSLILDHQSAIIADTSKVTAMIPVEVKIKGPEGLQTVSSQVLAHRYLTPQLIALILTNGIGVVAPDLSPAVLKVKTSVKLRGFDPLVFHDYIFAADGFSPGAIGTMRGVRVLMPLLFNPFEPVKIERFECEAELTYKTDVAQIESLRLQELEVPVEKEFELDVVMRPYNGAAYVKKIPITIPRRLAGAVLKVEVSSGDQARVDIAPPDNLGQLVAALRRTFPGTQLVATVLLPDEGITLEGSMLPNLPESALDTIRPGTSSRRVEPYRSVSRFVVPTTQVVQGRGELTFRVADDQPSAR
jgi:hypothetical protein